MSAYGTLVTAPAAYPTQPNVTVPFEPTQMIFRAESGGFLFSFDGVQDHGHCLATDTFVLKLDVKLRKVWIKQDAGGASDARFGAFS